MGEDSYAKNRQSGQDEEGCKIHIFVDIFYEWPDTEDLSTVSKDAVAHLQTFNKKPS